MNDETIRYLASYIKDNFYECITYEYGGDIDGLDYEKLMAVIKEFFNTIL